MAHDSLIRRLLAALADSTPAFTPPHTAEAPGRSRRLLAALADSSPAFTPSTDSDQYTSRPTATYTSLCDPAPSVAPASSTPPTAPSAPSSALGKFATDFAARPPHERLAARRWFPSRQLAAGRSSARLAFQALNIRLALDRDSFDLAHDLASRLNNALDRDLAQDLVFRLNNALDRDLTLDLTRNLILDLTRNLTLDLILDLVLDLTRAHADALDRAYADTLDLDRAIVLDLNHDLAYALDRGRALTLAHALDRDRAYTYAFDRAHALAYALDRAIALILDVAHAHAHALAHDRDRDRDLKLDLALVRAFVEALDRLNEAVSDVVNADLTQVDLRGIPLAGVRWSHETRWPEQWESQIRRDSVEIAPGLYEIRPGGIEVDVIIDALV